MNLFLNTYTLTYVPKIILACINNSFGSQMYYSIFLEWDISIPLRTYKLILINRRTKVNLITSSKNDIIQKFKAYIHLIDFRFFL